MEETTPFYYSIGVCEGVSIKKQAINRKQLAQLN